MAHYGRIPLGGTLMTIIEVYIGAALAENGGCFAFWMWLRLGHLPWWGLLGND